MALRRSRRLLVTETAELPQHFQLSAQLFAHYADEVLQITVAGQSIGSAVRDRITFDAAIAVAFLGTYQLALALPVSLYQHGDDPSGLGIIPARSIGPEDLRLTVNAPIWE